LRIGNIGGRKERKIGRIKKLRKKNKKKEREWIKKLRKRNKKGTNFRKGKFLIITNNLFNIYYQNILINFN